MHDYLFEHRNEAFDADNLMRAAGTLGLDRVKFDRAVAEHEYVARVQRDIDSGIASEVGGTPTIFINGRRNDDDDDFGTLKEKIDEAIMLSQPTKRKRDNPPLERTAAAVYFICGRASRVRRRGRSTAFRYPAEAPRPKMLRVQWS